MVQLLRASFCRVRLTSTQERRLKARKDRIAGGHRMGGTHSSIITLAAIPVAAAQAAPYMAAARCPLLASRGKASWRAAAAASPRSASHSRPARAK